MQITIENDSLQVTVETFGAELKSLKSRKSGLEYLWQGDPQVWKDTRLFSSRWWPGSETTAIR